MKKLFDAELEILLLSVNDIVTTSGDEDDPLGGDIFDGE